MSNAQPDDLITLVEQTYLRNELTAEGRELLSLVATRMRFDAVRIRKLEAERDHFRDCISAREVRALVDENQRLRNERSGS